VVFAHTTHIAVLCKLPGVRRVCAFHSCQQGLRIQSRWMSRTNQPSTMSAKADYHRSPSRTNVMLSIAYCAMEVHKDKLH